MTWPTSTLDAAQVAELGAYALRLLGPVGAAAAAFGLLFIPSPNDVRVEGEVPEIPGLSYSWNRDETVLHLTYDDPDGGQRTFSAELDGDVFRDAQGRVIGRVLSGGTVAIDAAAVSSDLVDEDEPRLCPDYVNDKRTNDMGVDYEIPKIRRHPIWGTSCRMLPERFHSTTVNIQPVRWSRLRMDTRGS